MDEFMRLVGKLIALLIALNALLYLARCTAGLLVV
ncbi:hypothetical protein HMPREF9452_00408 [Collinsella tanakaei YIT 12063]|uniref:Uncharacterized protein n=1 Tax=Collinsella tanakaei YIT 12063 TaxID=742742 RepID=G1WGE5_9ACTN|nr:hypothetical protein HMPREF9452_00408 [Collinsella tanakaei YIT 12063]